VPLEPQEGRSRCASRGGVDEILAGTLVDWYNHVAARLCTREEVAIANGEVDMLVIEVVLEDDEVLAISVGGDKRLESILGLRSTLLAGRNEAVNRGFRDGANAAVDVDVCWPEVQ